jgi:aldose 1-epimerase
MAVPMDDALANILRSGSALLLICGMLQNLDASAAVTTAVFGQADGKEVEIYTLTNAHGIEARISSYGATLVSLKTPDRDGHLKNIVLGFERLDGYLADGVPYYGATIGRYANRIAKGRFSLDGIGYQLPLNDGPNSLHGGRRGFDKRVWSTDKVGSAQNSLRLSYVSAAGEEGYPGELTAHVTYRLGEDDSLEIDFEATTTAPTPVNLANHAYFNLTGDPNRPIVEHTLQINAEAFTPVDATLIPTGEAHAVAGTPFDFRHAASIGSRIGAGDEQLTFGHGYDHNWVLAPAPSKGAPRLAAVLSDPGSGRVMEIRTTQPGLQFYSGNFLNGKPSGQGSVYAYRTGLCLETQHFPDSPNHPAFPNTILRPGETYAEKTILRFRTSKSR